MKASKIAIRFFEQHDKESADNYLFDLFHDWREVVKPDIRLERKVYIVLCDIREFVDTSFSYIQSGVNLELGFYLLNEEICIDWAITLDKLYNDWVNATLHERGYKKELIHFLNRLIEFISCFDCSISTYSISSSTKSNP